MSKRRGLGRGLGALIPTDQDEETTPKSSGIQTVKVEQIQPNPHQPRTLMEETKLNELAGKPLPESFGQLTAFPPPDIARVSPLPAAKP